MSAKIAPVKRPASEGFASSSASGESDLAHAFAQELEDREVPASAQIQQAADLIGPHSVEGFLIYLEQRGLVEQ